MDLPLFFIEEPARQGSMVTLGEDSSRHILKVLRMKEGDLLQLTDGKGNLHDASITAEKKKTCIVEIHQSKHIPDTARQVHLCVSLLKNPGRFEWLLEKATEIGVSSVVPLICARTEKQFFRHERMKSIVISAMLQSKQTWMPRLFEPVSFADLFKIDELESAGQRYIAHCLPGEEKKTLLHSDSGHKTSSLILIGPEGDFNESEIELALKNQFLPVALGDTRLRSETAALAAVTLLKIGSV